MDESILNALMQLFAMGTLVRSDSENFERSRQVIYEYLSARLNKELTEKYFKRYEDYVRSYIHQLHTDHLRRKKLSAQFVKLLKIAERINETLHQSEKIIVIVRLLELFSYDRIISKDEEDFISTIIEIFHLDQQEAQSIKFFSLDNFELIPAKQNLLFVLNPSLHQSLSKQLPQARYIIDPNIDEKIAFLFIPSTEMLIFKYMGSMPLKITSRNIVSGKIYIFDSGAIIQGKTIKPIYQTQIISQFLTPPNLTKVTLLAKDIEFFYPGSQNGIHKFTFEAHSGQLIGVIGASGSGKSTLLNLLIGKYPLHRGQILINGYDLHKDKQKLIPLIGYVPQDDLLIEELTVYQNLYYNAKLCFGNLPDSQIRERVEQTLKELQLYEIRDLKVGNPLNKFISGGQRKRLNIALELIRQPAILFVDEPTSGLSSMDSEIVMHLLKRQAISGKLVIVNIHQPSSDIFKLFDQIIVLDKGGYPVYRGNPLEAITYFKQVENYVDADIAQCPTCGTVQPEIILEILEEKVVDEWGRYTQMRRTSPKEWYILYKVNIEKRTRFRIPPKSPLPKSDFKPPTRLKQYLIFGLRDIKAKLADIQYILITLLEAPILALILAYISRMPAEDGGYMFIENSNLPVFLFMAVVVAIFLGLTISAEEIIKDKRILERERFLRLSKMSYLLAKVSLMLAISAYQIFTFVIISNWILGIKALNWQFWLILFSTAAAANLLGLIISASLDSVVAIYIIIPLILVPQMLLGGAMINFDQLPKALNNPKYTPTVADIMFSRWAYEGLMVEQFKNNLFQRHFFDLEKQKSNAIYVSFYQIPELQKITDFCVINKHNPEAQAQIEYYLSVIRNELDKLQNLPTLDEEIKRLAPQRIELKSFSMDLADSLHNFFKQVQTFFNLRTNQINQAINSRLDSLKQIYGKQGLIRLKNENFNQKVAQIVRNRNQLKQVIIYDHQLIRKKDPIFMEPYSRWGRAHLYASEKIIGNWHIDTLTFNVIVLWAITIVLFVILYFDLVRKVLAMFSIRRRSNVTSF